MSLTDAMRRRIELQAAIANEEKTHNETMKSLKAELSDVAAQLVMAVSDIDTAKVILAETILFVTDYSRGGDDRESCIKAAIKQFALGTADSPYCDLWRVRLATKSYDRWYGQRADCEYGYGPRHGQIIFEIGLTPAARKRQQSDLTPDEVEACLYYLANIERIQSARRDNKAA